MATFYCTKCNERMWNGSDMNTFEHFLINQNVYNLEQKKYDKLIRKVNKEYKENQKDPEFGKDYKEIDTWFDVCFELGNDVWICPECKTMHIFERGGNKLEQVYILENKQSVGGKPVIGIVSKPNKFDIKLLQNQIVYEPVRLAVLKNGGLCMGLLPTQATENFYEDEIKIDRTALTNGELEDLHQLIDRCDGIILEGGLSSASYEYEVARYAIKKDIPLLGICAGFNNIIRAMGGDVFQENVDRHNVLDGSIAHKNIIKEDSLLYSILGMTEVDVNSLHNFFAKDEGVKNLEISAHSDDGYVEAVELKGKRFVLGVKWHPELMLKDTKMDEIFKRFISACHQSH